MTAAEVLEAAADYIDEHGWCREEYVASDGSVCAFEAIERARLTEPLAGVELVVEAAMKSATGCATVEEWNDAPGRTKDEVVRKLREVAASLAGPMAPPVPVREEEEEVEEPEPVAA